MFVFLVLPVPIHLTCAPQKWTVSGQYERGGDLPSFALGDGMSPTRFEEGSDFIAPRFRMSAVGRLYLPRVDRNQRKEIGEITHDLPETAYGLEPILKGKGQNVDFVARHVRFQENGGTGS